MGRRYFDAADYVIFSLTIGVSVVIGFYYWLKDRKTHSTADYILAGRKMSILPVALSLLASFFSAIGMLGIPVEIYMYGTMYAVSILAQPIFIAVSAHIFCPVFYRLGVTSSYEYLEMRFGRAMRMSGAAIFIFQMVLYSSMVLYLPCMALEATTGLNRWTTVTIAGLSCTIYTTFGGMKGVMWSDAFQVFVIFASLLSVIIRGLIMNGGFAGVWNANVEGGRVELLNFSLNPTTRHTYFSQLIGNALSWTGTYAVNQAQVQRAVSCPSLRHAKIAYWINWPGQFLAVTTSVACGFILYATYRNCDPIKSKLVSSADQMMPLFVMDHLSDIPGMPGLFVAGLFAGSLSTLSTSYNSLAAVTVRDVVQTYVNKNMSDRNAAITTKVLSFFFGILSTGLTYPISRVSHMLNASLGLAGIVGGPLLGAFSLGMLVPWSNSIGALVGFWSSMLLSLWIAGGYYVLLPYIPKLDTSVSGCMLNSTAIAINATLNTAPRNVYSGILAVHHLSYAWYAALGFFPCVIVGIIVSLLTGATKSEDVNPDLLSPLVLRWLRTRSKVTPAPNSTNQHRNHKIQESRPDKKLAEVLRSSVKRVDNQRFGLSKL